MKEETVLRKVDVAKPPKKAGKYHVLVRDYSEIFNAYYSEKQERFITPLPDIITHWYEEITLGELIEQPNVDQETINLLCDVYQLLTGWHSDGTSWTDWDESIRQRVLNLQKKLIEKSKLCDCGYAVNPGTNICSKCNLPKLAVSPKSESEKWATSNCCDARLYINSGTTSFYSCSKCHNPCDPKSESVTGDKEELLEKALDIFLEELKNNFPEMSEEDLLNGFEENGVSNAAVKAINRIIG